jgi:hypothetical protein
MKMIRTRCLPLFAGIFLLCAGTLSAQAPLEPAQLPANTAFYLVWRGQPSAEIRKTNSIAALWDDPGFAPVRSSIANALLKNSEEKSTDKKLTREQLDEYASLLDNSFVLGYLSDPHKRDYVVSANPSSAKTTPWNGLFFIYDRTGKEAILTKAVLGLRTSEKEVPQISQVTVSGVAARRVQRASGVTYWVENGKYAISTGDTSVLEEILNRLSGKSSSGSLGDAPAYKEAQSALGAGQVEFFLRVGDLKSLAADSSAGGFRVSSLLDAIRLEAIHSISGRVLLDGAKTRVQAAALGDTAPGSLFDIWGPGTPAPASLSVVPADAVSYSDTQIDLTGLYGAVKRIGASILPPGQQGNIDMVEMMAQAKLGQSLSSALALFTGEFASMQTSTSLDNNKQIYLVGIHDKTETVKLLHTLLTDRISAERNEGETTFMKISTAGGGGAAGKAPASAATPQDFYHIAATSDYLVAAPTYEAVRELLAKRSAAGLSTTAGFQSARAQFPANINGFGYFDFRKLDWKSVKARMVAEANKAPATTTKRSQSAPKSSATQNYSWIQEVNTEAFARHLHVASSASWKDAQGLHFDQWIE